MIDVPLADRPHALYRFFDSANRLLYVGITAALPTRLMSHNGDKPWWTSVHHITVEHFADRETVLKAETAAIKAEHPLHNITHNQRPTSTIGVPRVHDVPANWRHWSFRTRDGYTRTVPLWLNWEVHCDPISDDYAVDDVGPDELWREWLQRYPTDDSAEAVYGPGAVRIWWSIEGPGTFEYAPFQDWRGENEFRREGHDFLGFFSWPEDSVTGEPLQWSRLPVIDKVWRTEHLPQVYTMKGGFIQEATGWKPAPMQPYVNVNQLARMAGLYAPGPW